MAANAQMPFQNIGLTEELAISGSEEHKTFSHLISFFSRTKLFDLKKLMIAERDLTKKINLYLPLQNESFVNVSLNELLSFRKKEITENIKVIMKRIQRGDKCFATVTEDGELTSISWVSFGWSKKDGVKLDLNEDEALLLESFTFEEFRNKGSQSFNIGMRLKILEELNFTKAYVIYSKGNTFSKKALRKNGFKDCKKIFYLTILGIKFQFSWDIFTGGLRKTYIT